MKDLGEFQDIVIASVFEGSSLVRFLVLHEINGAEAAAPDDFADVPSVPDEEKISKVLFQLLTLLASPDRGRVRRSGRFRGHDLGQAHKFSSRKFRTSERYLKAWNDDTDTAIRKSQ
jgi:hypothetical protein